MAYTIRLESKWHSSTGEGSTVLTSATSAFNLGGRASEGDVTPSLEDLNFDDEEEESRCVYACKESIFTTGKSAYKHRKEPLQYKRLIIC
jgi:hypothetical protein